MTLTFAMRALRRRVLLILITAAAVAVAGLMVGSALPKTYTSQSAILLGLDIKGSTTDPQTANLYLKDRVATYAELVSADEVIGPVATSAGISPDELRQRVVVAIVPETVVLAVSVSADSSEQAVQLTQAVSQRFRAQVSALNVRTGGPKILPAQLSSPQPATAPDQLHGSTLFAVSALAGLVVAVLLALVLALVEAGRAVERAPQSSTQPPLPQLNGHAPPAPQPDKIPV